MANSPPAPWLPKPVGYAEDMARSVPSGLKRGAELLGGTAEGAGGTAAWILGKVARALGMPEEATQTIEQAAQTGVSGALNPVGHISEMVRDFGGPDVTRAYAPTADTLKEDTEGLIPGLSSLNYKPETLPGKIVHTAGEIAPSVAFGPGNALTKGLVTAGSAIGDEGTRAGAEAANTQLPDWAQIPPGMIDALSFAGSVVGGMGAPGAWNKLSRPYPAEPGRIPLRQELDRHNVPYSAGQGTGNDRLIARENVAGGVPALQEQGPAFTQAAGRIQGGFPARTNTLSRDAMGDELGRMGDEFDRMASISNAPMDDVLVNDLSDVVTRYQENPVVGGRVERIVNDLFDNSQQQGGRVTGQGYKDANSKIGDIIRGTEDDAERTAMIEVKRLLDDAVEQNLPPAEQGNWRRVRQQYRDYLPIEKAKAQSSPTASRGVITPSALKTGIKAVEGTREIASGTRPMTALAEAGQGIMEKTPNSGTPIRNRQDIAQRIAATATGGAGVGGAAALMGLPPPLAAALGIGTTAVSAIAPVVRDAYTRSGIGQSLMGRQGPVADRAAIAALLAQIQQMQQRTGGPLAP